jgi:tetratricopeptide (TPR) repeat protein
MAVVPLFLPQSSLSRTLFRSGVVFAIALCAQGSWIYSAGARELGQTENRLNPSALQLAPTLTPLPTPLRPARQDELTQQHKEQILNSRELDRQIEDEVQRTFGWTISLLNMLITVLIAIPVITGLAAIYLRRSATEQLVRELKQQLQQDTKSEVEAQLKQQVSTELAEQIEAFKQELEQLKTNFIAELQDMQKLAVTMQQEKEQIFQSLKVLTPSMIQEEFVAPEIARKLQKLTTQLIDLRKLNPQLGLTLEEYVEQGNALYFEGFDERLLESLACYERAIALDSYCFDAWVGKAKALRRLERYDEALAANDRLIRIDPQRGHGWFGRGFCLAGMHQYEAAITAYDHCLGVNSAFHHAWKLRGYALTHLGRYDEAIVSLERALALHPNSGGTHYHRAYYYAVQGDVDRAIADLERAIQLTDSYDFASLVRSDSDFDSIRADPRFQALLAQHPPALSQP